MDRETKTTELDPAQLGVLLEDADRVLRKSPTVHPLGSVPMESQGLELDRPTVQMQRDELLGLIDRSTPPSPSAHHVHTVTREQLRARASTLEDGDTSHALAQVPLDMNIRPSMSPLVLYGFLAVIAIVFLAAWQLAH